MSDILADIDDTLADWNGSADSMRWRPDYEGESPINSVAATGWASVAGALVELHSAAMQASYAATEYALLYGDRTTLLEPFSLEVELPLAEPAPEQDYWKTAAWQRYIAAMFDIRPRDIGLPPRYGFDARYRQRQKNRRKRRR